MKAATMSTVRMVEMADKMKDEANKSDVDVACSKFCSLTFMFRLSLPSSYTRAFSKMTSYNLRSSAVYPSGAVIPMLGHRSTGFTTGEEGVRQATANENRVHPLVPKVSISDRNMDSKDHNPNREIGWFVISVLAVRRRRRYRPVQ